MLTGPMGQQGNQLASRSASEPAIWKGGCRHNATCAGNKGTKPSVPFLVDELKAIFFKEHFRILNVVVELKSKKKACGGENNHGGWCRTKRGENNTLL